MARGQNPMPETKTEAKTSIMFKKNIPNVFELREYLVPNEPFAMPELSGDQKKAFDHAVKCGLITKV